MSLYWIYKHMPLMVLYLPTVKYNNRIYDLEEILGLLQTKHYTILNQGEVYSLVYHNDPKEFIPGQIRCILMADLIECGIVFIWDELGIKDIKNAMYLVWYGIPNYDYTENKYGLLPSFKAAMDTYNGLSDDTFGIHFINELKLYNSWNPDNYTWELIPKTPNFKIGKTICND